MKKKTLGYDCIVINSNRYFSAVTDYSLQLTRFLKSQKKNVLFCADSRQSAMPQKCIENQIDFMHIPLNNHPFTNFFVSFFKIIFLLFTQKKLQTVFVFEGRDMTQAALSKFIFPFLWKNKQLIRIRGQARRPKKDLFHFLLYRFFTNQIIYVSDFAEKSTPFTFPEGKSKICYYGKTDQFPTKEVPFYTFEDQNYTIHFSQNILTFFMLGRFDPVKGHDSLLEAFRKANFNNIPTQLICVGIRQSISAECFYEKYKNDELFTNNFKKDWLYQLSTSDGLKKVILIEKRFDDTFLFMKQATFGVISSLGSEFICRVGVEFLQAGIPVIYSDVGSLPEVFSNFPDFKFKHGDVDALMNKFELACEIFQKSEHYLQEKEKSYEIWKNHYHGDIYSNIHI